MRSTKVPYGHPPPEAEASSSSSLPAAAADPKARPSEAVIAAAEAVVEEDSDNEDEEMAFSSLFFDLRCRRNTLCVRGPRHPGLCRPIASHARCVSRILAMYTSTHKYQRVTQFLVQYEDDSRALAAWSPRPPF